MVLDQVRSHRRSYENSVKLIPKHCTCMDTEKTTASVNGWSTPKSLGFEKEGGVGGVFSPDVNDVTAPSGEAVRIAGVDVGGFGGAAPAAGSPGRIWNWHDIFRHINRRWAVVHGQNYPWNNADRKVLANTARKYGAPAILAMFDLYFQSGSAWDIRTKGSIYGMVRDGGRLRDDPRFKALYREHERRLDSISGAMTAAETLKMICQAAVASQRGN